MDEARPANLEIQKIPKIKILKIKICVAQNVGKVWIIRRKQAPAPFGAISGNFCPWAGKCKKNAVFLQFSLVVQWLLFNRFGEMIAIFLVAPVRLMSTHAAALR